jgi:RNA polymerase sigma factor for flagellar operon FliA
MLISLDDYLEQNYESTASSLVSDDDGNPERQYENQEVKRLLTEGINSLNEKQRQVITLYYFEELTLKEISRIMGVSESRVSQIHSNCVRILKNKLGKYKSILFLK